MTSCLEQITLNFQEQNEPIVIAFDGPEVSSNGGFLLIGQLDRKLGISERVARLLPDTRDPNKVVHPRLEQVRQRLYQITHGYEDCNDADQLRHDPVLNSACGTSPSQGGLSSQPTFSRLENAVTMRDIRALLVDFEQYYIDSLDPDTEVVVLDIDTSDDPTHGQQAFTFFHGYYGHYMYHPMFIFDGLTGQLVTVILRPGNTSASRGSGHVLERIIRGIRKKCPNAIILVRGDSGFSVPRLHDRLDRLEQELLNVDYLLGQAKNDRLKAMAEPHLKDAKQEYERTGQKVRDFFELEYAAKSWQRTRRVLGKAEHTSQGANPRFVVTSLEELTAQQWYDGYCMRGQAENYIKDFMNAMAADRLSCSSFEANFFRLLEHGWAYRLMWALRQEVKAVGEMAKGAIQGNNEDEMTKKASQENNEEASEVDVEQMELLSKQSEQVGKYQFDNLRLQLLKVGVYVKETLKGLRYQLPRSFPLARLFRQLLTQGACSAGAT